MHVYLNDQYNVHDVTCMIFISGFSRQIVQLLNENNIRFSTFDILQDNDVRQGKLVKHVLAFIQLK